MSFVSRSLHAPLKQISRQQGRLTKARLQHKESASFRSDQFKYGRRTFRPQTTTKPDFNANEAMKYFRSVYTDPRREFQYEPYEVPVFFLPKVFCVPGRKFVDLDAS